MPIISRTLIRDYGRNGRDRIVAHLELRYSEEGEQLVGGLSPAFSATCSIYEDHGGAWSGRRRHLEGKDADGGGAALEEIVKAFPHLKPLVDLHLSDPDGTPMHAEANGWYWYAGSRPDLREHERYTGYSGDIYKWRLDERGLTDDQAGREAYCYLLACELLRVSEIPKDLDRAQFRAFVTDQRPRWQREAAAARALLESLPEEE